VGAGSTNRGEEAAEAAETTTGMWDRSERIRHVLVLSAGGLIILASISL